MHIKQLNVVKVARGWRRLHNEELRNLYASPNIIRVIEWRGMRWEGHIARMGEMRNAYKVLVWKPEGKRQLVRPRHRWEDNIRMDETGQEGVEWNLLTQDKDK